MPDLGLVQYGSDDEDESISQPGSNSHMVDNSDSIDQVRKKARVTTGIELAASD